MHFIVYNSISKSIMMARPICARFFHRKRQTNGIYFPADKQLRLKKNSEKKKETRYHYYIFPSKVVSLHTIFRLPSINKPFRYASSKSFASILKTETQIQKLQIHYVFNECKNVVYSQ